MRRIMKIEDIKISNNFLEHPPKREKIEMKKLNSFDEVGNQTRSVKLNKDNVLINGYATLLAAKELGYKSVWVKGGKRKDWTSYQEVETTYIFGTHPNSNCTKEFCWRVPASWTGFADNIQIGDTVLCTTKFGCSPVVVNRIEVLDKPPIDLPIKKVCRKEIRRNGLVVEI